MEKRCCRCRIYKKFSEFNKNRSSIDGLEWECRTCRAIVKKQYRLNYSSKIALREKLKRRKIIDGTEKVYMNDTPSMQLKIKEIENRNIISRIRNKRNRLNKKLNGEKSHVQIWRQRNPEKAKAHNNLNRAVYSGKIERKPCCICGNWKSHAHHEDYSKPLEVIWLCPKHHSDLHHKKIII